MSKIRISRREFLQSAGFFSAAALLQKPLSGLASRGALPARPGASMPGVRAQMGEFMPDAEVDITAVEKWLQVMPGEQTKVWSYEGALVSGSGVTVQPVPNSSLGPILRAKSGTKVRINFYNHLAEDSVIHPHGLRVPEDCDGQPMQAIGPGEKKVYDFQVIDRAGPYWFHPHPMMRTAEQVAMGMAGAFYVWDDDEALAVPGASTGDNDVPVIIQDRLFDTNGQLVFPAAGINPTVHPVPGNPVGLDLSYFAYGGCPIFNKFDAVQPAPAAADRAAPRVLRYFRVPESRLVVVAGSTMKGEELFVLRAFERARASVDHPLLVIAPRHPERFDAVASNLGGKTQAAVLERAWRDLLAAADEAATRSPIAAHHH